jgi:hypothetical protein
VTGRPPRDRRAAPVRAERGKDDGFVIDDRADARWIVHVTRPLVQARRVGEGDVFGIARNGGDGVPALQRLSGDGESGAAGCGEDGQVRAETLEGPSGAIKCKIDKALFPNAEFTRPGSGPAARRRRLLWP